MWYLIPARFVSIQLALVGSILVYAGDSTSIPLVSPGVGWVGVGLAVTGMFLFLISLFSIIPLAMERRRLSKETDGWEPGLLYFIIAIPGIGVGIPLSMLYTYKRLKWVGPSSQKL